MIEEYGKEKFAELLSVYERGAAPDDGLVQVYGMNQNQIENAWRTKIGAPEREISNSGLPTVLVRPTYDISSPFGSTATPSSTATPEPTLVSVAVTPDTPSSSIPSQSPSFPASGLCGGVLALSGLVTFSLLKRRRHI